MLLLRSFDRPAKITELRQRSLSAGFRMPNTWNPSTSLSRARKMGLVTGTPAGWEITNTGREHLARLGVSADELATLRVAKDLRRELSKIKNQTTRAFAAEGITCYEQGLHRSAIVMSWLAALDI